MLYASALIATLSCVLFTSACALSPSPPSCLYNTTHCSCRKNMDGGACLRKSSGSDAEAICTVDTCQTGGYSCDCLGDSICKMETCTNWITKDGVPVSHLQKGISVPCKEKSDGTCLAKVQMPVEYKMVQFGSKSPNNVAGTMFNLSMMPDVNNKIISRYRMSDKWDHPETLRFRHITMRMYQSTTGEHFLCTVFNTYGFPHDGNGMMKVTTTIKGLAGQQLRWVACDDKKECAGGPALTLTATHTLSFTHSDGWCVMPVSTTGEAISVKFDNVQGFEGISFQLSDGEEDAYYFREDGDLGMTGSTDSSGLVVKGAVPEIIFNLAGIEVPQ